MGSYIALDLEQKHNGAPIFVKTVTTKSSWGNSTTTDAAFLYRFGDGSWMATVSKSDIAKGVGGVQSSKSAELPFEEGLKWKYFDGHAWQYDRNITCSV
eukprot:CAMPEP_0182579202 /NCGR_PEP_ID=MMETSP1324-20130603/43561_1 /TAXON_ID=236786 /ORGANISM="Florenciella sp., Strain RCC1587" /LENGTH=98 /DNA_ID=CAMNT_0024795269 /DNA_START=1 /DNA_END=297 /DNA_ORIENTATION=+